MAPAAIPTRQTTESGTVRIAALRRFLQAVTDIFLPEICPLCDRISPASPCKTCRRQLVAVQPPFCPVCGVPFPHGSGTGHHCPDCLNQKFHFDQARSAFIYQPPLDALIHSFKYRRDMTALSFFGHAMRQAIPPAFLRESDLLVPVPLHRRRLRQRSYNQALLLARSFCPGQRRKIDPFVLIRHRYTPPQTGRKGTERRRSLRKAFAVSDPARVKGKTVLLIDDVLTTGTTVNECARALKAAGATGVLVATLARVLP